MRRRHDQSMRSDTPGGDNQKTVQQPTGRLILREKQGQMRHSFVHNIHGT